jgi:hypothetical protein
MGHRLPSHGGGKACSAFADAALGGVALPAGCRVGLAAFFALLHLRHLHECLYILGLVFFMLLEVVF